MIKEQLDTEIERIKSAALSGGNNAIERMTNQIMDDAQAKVYSYQASPFAMRTRRGAENGGVGSREAIDLIADTDDGGGHTLFILEGEVSRPLQHSYSKRSGIEWGADAVDVVVTGDERFNQGRAGARPYIDEYKLNSILEEEMYSALYEWL